MSALLRAGMIAAIIGAVAIPGRAHAQGSPSDFTSAARYDAMHRVVGAIDPDPDGAGSIHYAATRTTYDAAGRAISVEKGELSSWQSEAVAPASWTGFTIFQRIDTTYDAMDRKLTEKLSSGGTAYTLTQYSYDSSGRLECTAVRMNPAAFGSLPASACTLGTEGSQGPDRVTRNVYDAAGQVLKVQKAYGTALVEDYATYSYSANGKQVQLIDANGNPASMTYDGFDRQVQWNFPSAATPGTVSGTDYEAYSYDANGNRLTLRKRDGNVIGYSYDALNRVTVKDIPGGTTADVYYSYDVYGHQTSARFGSSSGAGLSQTYDGFGRLASAANNLSGTALTLSYQYDADGNRTRVTHPDGTYFTFAYDGLDRQVTTSENGTTVVATVTYDSQGRRAGDTRGAAATTYGYDAVSRPTSIADDLAGSTYDLTTTLGYNPASQIVSKVRSNNAYAFGGYVTLSRSYAANGLNQYTTAGPATFTYDANGNLTGDGTNTFGYDVENRLVSRSGGLALSYDPDGRLWQTSGAASGTTRYLYDGDELAVEYDGSGNVLRRYVHGPGADDPTLWYEGAGVADRRSLQIDSQGSIVSVADASGNTLGINAYDEYGIPNTGNIGRFQYTGQAWLSDLGMYYYKARIYSPTLGRFMQTDPIGYKDQINLYAYVGSDPVDGRDPTGNETEEPATGSHILQHHEKDTLVFIVDIRSPGGRLVQAVVTDPRVKAQINEAWKRSLGDKGPTRDKNEYGFWVRRTKKGFEVGRLVRGWGFNMLKKDIDAAHEEMPDANIFLHVHPFRSGEVSGVTSIGIDDDDRSVAWGLSENGRKKAGIISVARPEPYNGRNVYVDYDLDPMGLFHS